MDLLVEEGWITSEEVHVAEMMGSRYRSVFWHYRWESDAGS